MPSKDLRTKAYILRRTNYGEADRILNLITPTGKVSAMAKGVRKEKSKLAGNIEMFCLVDANIHQGKNDFGLITSAKMIKYFSNLIIDLPRMELAAQILKKIDLVSDNSDNPEFFSIVEQCFEALDQKISPDLVAAWFWFNLAKACGEDINLYRDTNGEKLSPDENYIWDNYESALAKQAGGNIGSDEIKIMRLMCSTKLAFICQIKDIMDKIPAILYIAKAINKL